MKPRKPEKNLVVGLDVGTSKIVAIVGEGQPDGTVEVIGIGSHPSTGLKRGVVVDMASTEQAIQRAVEEAELMAGCEIHSVYAGISGSHMRSLNSDGTVAIKDKEVSEGDVERVLDAARAVPVAADQKILHVLPQEYVIDYVRVYQCARGSVEGKWSACGTIDPFVEVHEDIGTPGIHDYVVYDDGVVTLGSTTLMLIVTPIRDHQ